MEIVDALPLSAAGKVLKRELRKPYWEGQDRAVHWTHGAQSWKVAARR